MEQPSYEELAAAYQLLVLQALELRIQVEALKGDSINERLKTLAEIVKGKDIYPEQIVKLATWHMKKILAKK